MRLSSGSEIFSFSTHLLSKRPYSPVILLKPDTAMVISADGQISEEMSLDAVWNRTRDTGKPLILLSAPYLFSYVHKTILLPKKELLRADQQVLHFSRFPAENRIIESFDFGADKAITVHSHLSEEGVNLINELRKAKQGFKWEPSVSFLLKNLFRHHDSIFGSFGSVTITFLREILHIEFPGSEPPDVRHFFSIWSDLPQASQVELMRSSLRTGDIKEPNFQINLNTAESPPEITRLLFNSTPLKSSIKHIKRETKKRVKRLNFLLSPLAILVLISLIVLGSSASSRYRLLQLKQQRQNLVREVNQLKQVSGELQSLAENERFLAKEEAMRAALKTHQVNPVQVIKTINEILPDTTWIKKLSLSHEEIILELFDTNVKTYSTVLNQLSKQIGPAQLEGNSKEELDETTVFYYKLRIRNAKK